MATCLRERVFSYFSLSYILHSDNGREFVNSVIGGNIDIWPGECKIVNRKPGSPWVQGCVEKGNHSVDMIIPAKQHERNSNNWATCLQYLSQILY